MPSSGATLFGRRVRVILGKPPPDYKTLLPGAIEVEDLRITFKVSKSTDKTPNTAEASIYNLSAANRAQFQGAGHKLILLAGFEGTIAQIFSGDVRTIDHTKNGPDWVTRAQCGDGERAFQFARVNESFAAGTRVADVVKACATALGLELGNTKAALAPYPDQFVSGYSAAGPASRELDRALRPLGLAWSVQDGRLQILKPGTLLSNTAIELGETVVGSPEYGNPQDKGKPSILKVKALLQPDIVPGCKLLIRTKAIPGQFFRAQKVEHSGDTAGGEWYTSAECVPL